MNVLLVNGSPKPKSCTYTALMEVGGRLNEAGIATEVYQIGGQPVRPCIACLACRRKGENYGRCAFNDDKANELAEKMRAADGIVVGSPVYYAGPNGSLCALLDRVFYMDSDALRHKPAAALVSCRRAGSTAALDRLQKYFTINRMPLITSQYWAMVHGTTPGEVRQDAEGMEIMRTLGDEMAWVLQSIEKGGLPVPAIGQTQRTNFVRQNP